MATRRLSCCAVVLFLIAAVTTCSSAAVITIGASKDNTIFQSNVTNSLGGGQAMFVGTNNTPSPRRELIAFDVAGAVPAGSTINSVQLTLVLNMVAGTGTGSPTIRLFPVSSDWGEGTAGNGSTGSSGTGNGFAAGDGDATWNARRYSATTPTAWSTPGGDFNPTASGSSTIVGTTVNTPNTWTSTPAMVADVKQWLDTPSTNFGWLLKNDDETSAQTFRAFWTREAARTNQSAFVPQLQIDFTPVPEPAAGLLALGCMAGLLRRSR